MCLRLSISVGAFLTAFVLALLYIRRRPNSQVRNWCFPKININTRFGLEKLRRRKSHGIKEMISNHRTDGVLFITTRTAAIVACPCISPETPSLLGHLSLVMSIRSPCPSYHRKIARNCQNHLGYYSLQTIWMSRLMSRQPVDPEQPGHQGSQFRLLLPLLPQIL